VAYALDIYTGDGSTVLFNVTFPVLQGDEIVVSVNGVELDPDDFALNPGFTQVTLDVAPAVDAEVRVFRRTDISEEGEPVDFQDGGAIVAPDLDRVNAHKRHAIQELYDAAVLEGLQGPPGPEGPEGPPGPQGEPGADGADGADGAGSDDTAVFMAM